MKILQRVIMSFPAIFRSCPYFMKMELKGDNPKFQCFSLSLYRIEYMNNMVHMCMIILPLHLKFGYIK